MRAMKFGQPPAESRVMSFVKKAISRRTLVRALFALPGLALLRGLPTPGPENLDEIVEVDGWILKRSDLL